MTKNISNIKEIRKKLKKAKLPKEFQISPCEKIIDVNKFLDIHLDYLDVEQLFRKHRVYYERLKTFLDSLNIEIKIEEK